MKNPRQLLILPHNLLIITYPQYFIIIRLDATHYTWFFGDNDSTDKQNMDTVIHQYQYTGTFNACLVAYNQFGCSDTSCQDVQSLINPLLDVPNAFTPGRFGGKQYH